MTVNPEIPNSGTKLERMLEILLDTIISSRIWLRCYSEIGFNSPHLKSKGYSPSFGLFQMASTRLLAVEVFNIFDSDDNYDIVSVQKILKEIRLNKDCYAFYPSPMFIFYAKKLELVFKNVEEYSNLEKIIEKIFLRMPTFKKDSELKLIEEMRNNVVSHLNVDFLSQNKTLLPTDLYFDKLIDWADNFRLMIHEGFLPSHYAIDANETVTSSVNNLKMLLRSVIGETDYRDPENYKNYESLEGL